MYRVLLFVLIGGLLIGCESGQEVRSYVEDISPRDGSLQKTRKKTDSRAMELQWDKPHGWKEGPGTAMRLTSFTVDPQSDRGLCTVVALKGDGGGLQANVRRWMAQLNLSSDSEKDLSAFLSRQQKFTTKGGLPVRFIDFTSFFDSLDSVSMLVSVITVPAQTLFVKMVEKKGFLMQRREEFLSFSKSFSLGFRQNNHQ